MNFFEKEMRMMFEHTGIIQDPKFVGRTMVGILDDNLRVKMQFVSTFIANHYDAIQVSIINRTDGVVNKETMKFGDIIGLRKDNCGNNVHPYMWEQSDKTAYWYIPVSVTDKAKIADTALEYVGMYQQQDMSVNEMQFQ